ncbi:hypothetical protein QAD02_016024 [Eretmocerus hayati]|uniref:Uncharacterized protein n=1 Tax=Eretmocerus hayati TaxID=131215 RepID=A0ACC2P9W9_9HYME|nr:hypothetical protein QAD02_016024 [Eretmocerus hayati]
MGGLKSLAALALIKIKIVLAVAVVLAIVAFSMRYLFHGGLHGLIYKSNDLLYHEPYQHHPGPAYLPAVIHEPATVYGHAPQSSWDHHEIESYGNQWSKVGDGGRDFLSIPSMTSILQSIFFGNTISEKAPELEKRSRWKFKNIQR